MSSASSWMKDIHERVRRASNDVNVVLQPRVAQAKRSLEASIQNMGLSPGPEIFDGDDQLYAALADLDALRAALVSLSAAVKQHRTRLLDLARSQTALSALLQPQMRAAGDGEADAGAEGADADGGRGEETRPRRQRQQPRQQSSSGVSNYHSTINSLTELAAGLGGGGSTATGMEALLPLLRAHVPTQHVETQLSLANAQTFSANAISRFALDMSTPMADLSRTFEEAYQSKITPLKKRYIAQKTEYLRYSKQAEAADDEQRKRHLNSVAQSALPVWKATSESLCTETMALIKYSVSNLSEWTLNVAQAQREMFARSARAFEQPAEQAEEAQNSYSPRAV